MTSDTESLQWLRPIFSRMNRALMVPMWRLGLGRCMNAWPTAGRLLVLAHTGRRSGTRYLAPLNYAKVGDDVWVIAGFGPRTDWYRNVLADPNVVVWLPGGRWFAEAHDVTDSDDFIDVLRQVLIGSGFAAPLFGIHPKTMSDEELAAACADYRVVRLTLHTRVQGSEGRADLVWVWPVAAIGLVGMRLLRRAR
jgi:deazaflavin-dependent oxidoreductase (nitroreductase family)